MKRKFRFILKISGTIITGALLFYGVIVLQKYIPKGDVIKTLLWGYISLMACIGWGLVLNKRKLEEEKQDD